MALKAQRSILLATLGFGFLYCLTFHIFVPTSIVNFLRNTLRHNQQSIRTNLIIISYGRSGSSFLGQLFNQHPDVFYVYEPLKMIKSTTLGGSLLYEESATRLIKDILACRLDDQDEFLNFVTHMHHYRFSSKALTVPFCNRKLNNSLTRKWIYFCRPLDSLETSELCSKYKHTVIKLLTPRLPSLSLDFFKKLLGPKDKLKIIHLVRDPRSVVASMERVGWMFEEEHSQQNSFEVKVQNLCSSLLQSLVFTLETEKNLRENYKLIRYEDLVQDVYKVAKDLLQFAGVRSIESISSWIENNTNAPASGKSSENYQYLTSRSNITALAHSWKTSLSSDQIRVVEQHCRPVMKTLGYLGTNH